MPKSVSYSAWSLEHYAIGMKLRALRTRKRITLSRLAAETGLSTALLSKLETDRMIPTLPTLATICRVYGVGLSYFFCEAERHTLSITRKAHLQGTARNSEQARFIPVTPPGKGRLRGEMIEVTTAAPLALSEPTGETCALFYVIEGSLHFSAGAMKEVLEAGDCASIESTMPLAWSTEGKSPTRVLVVRPGDKAAA
jgi:transcriptional regulator with XRE-family HTH domain